MSTAPRPSRIEDETRLKEIWKLSFNDEDSFISAFFGSLYRPDMATVIGEQGLPVSSAYMLSGISLRAPDRSPMNCGYLYSLGTLPEFQGRGFASKIAEEAARRAYASGCDFVSTLPASPSLYDWYSRTVGARTRFWAREKALTAPVSATGKLSVISASRYNELREELLDARAHAAFSDELISWQDTLSRLCGGGLYELQTPDAWGCAVAEKDSSRGLFIKELLITDNSTDKAASLLMNSLDCKSCLLRTPVFIGDGAVRDFTVVFPPQSGVCLPVIQGAYWGLAFD